MSNDKKPEKKHNTDKRNKSNPNNKGKNKRYFKPKKNNKPKKKKTHKISEHFSKKDFICKESGKLRISLGLIGALELLRSNSKNRVNILKGYECPETSEKKKKIQRNYHSYGVAADITVDNLSAIEVFKLAENIEEIKGLGLNISDDYVHIDTRKDDERSLWVEEEEKIIQIDDTNRKTYIPDPLDTQ